MSSAQDSPQYRTVRGKKVASAAPVQPSIANPGHSGPTTFFLRSEKDIETQQRGRKTSREADQNTNPEDSMQKTPLANSMASETSFGVESLEDTINSTAFTDDRSLSRTNSNQSDASADPGAEANTSVASRKRKAGNPVHPRIAAAGQRIISGDYSSVSPQAPRTGSPVSLQSTDSPMRSHLRRGSTASSINLNLAANGSEPLTPLKMSPTPASAMPSTPRSGSPKSFRLSDEEASVASDSHSQALRSSGSEGGDEEEEGAARGEGLPQLVMPSLAMPTRRPFTERGRRLGRLRVMVVGEKGVGKTSLIQSLCRVCENVVHVDPASRSLHSNLEDEAVIMEVCASTRPYPAWWTDFESRRMLLRRKSVGEGVLERNLTFIDTPGFHGGMHVQQLSRYFKDSLARMGHMEKMSDNELVSMLSGEGGVQIDAVLYVFDSKVTAEDSPSHLQMDHKQAELLQYLSKWTNVVPIIGFADSVEAAVLVARKKQLLNIFESLHVEPYLSCGTNASTSDDEDPAEPFAISSAFADDSETIDASVLMASDYLQPLVPSQLETLVTTLFDPENAARLRHLSAAKFLLWRQENLGSHIDLQKQLLLSSPRFEPTSSTGVPSAGVSVLSEEPSKVLVPHGSSSYFRSPSPTISDSSAGANNAVAAAAAPSSSAYARVLNNASPSEPFRQVRMAKWAQDLQRSLDKERRKYQRMYTADWTSTSTGGSGTSESEKADPNMSLTTTRPSKGRLGGPLSIIDPRDPLGVLAFSQAFRRQGFFVLQVASGCGLVGAVVWWMVRNWGEVVDFFGLSGYTNTGGLVSVSAVPAPVPSSRGWANTVDFGEWKEWLGLPR